ncbi:hypothetical protein SAMN05421819_4285 [Bryocella elongata]|uniref:Outer membrane protein insertion porin family n=1 Tax=Bryocella elongata TaxID=863522 RepID=A0A1H6C899_9BACT|nr:hypothetical protein [Bryocella elongata]SEG68855.1 hypothetical protein SAMN05421819_4285 [Bryocella elongata]
MQSNKVRGLFLALGVSLCGAVASAQQNNIAQVVYSNPGPYSQQQLAAISGVKPGDPATAATLQAGAQKLSDTGFFDDIGAEIRGNTLHIVAVFKLAPTPKSQMLPVAFPNLVWLSPAEIDAAIHARVPLYFGYLQENTVPVDQVKAALEDALAAKGIAAKLEEQSIEPTLQHPFRSMAFTVVTPLPVVANVKLGGVKPEFAPLVQTSVNTAAGKPYMMGLAGLRTDDIILAPLLDAGYIDAALSGVAVETTPLDQHREPVILHATLDAGEIYHVSGLEFAGAPLLTTEAFNASAKLHAGDVASNKALIETLTPLDLAYRKLGYMDVIVKSNPSRDTAAHTVAYAVTVTPGEQYRLSKITAMGLDPAAQADFDKNFLLKAGDLYDPTYVAGFIKNNTALKTLAPYYGGYKAIANPDKHTVELELKFYTGPTVNVH